MTTYFQASNRLDPAVNPEGITLNYATPELDLEPYTNPPSIAFDFVVHNRGPVRGPDTSWGQNQPIVSFGDPGVNPTYMFKWCLYYNVTGEISFGEIGTEFDDGYGFGIYVTPGTVYRVLIGEQFVSVDDVRVSWWFSQPTNAALRLKLGGPSYNNGYMVGGAALGPIALDATISDIRTSTHAELLAMYERGQVLDLSIEAARISAKHQALHALWSTPFSPAEEMEAVNYFLANYWVPITMSGTMAVIPKDTFTTAPALGIEEALIMAIDIPVDGRYVVITGGVSSIYTRGVRIQILHRSDTNTPPRLVTGYSSEFEGSYSMNSEDSSTSPAISVDLISGRYWLFAQPNSLTSEPFTVFWTGREELGVAVTIPGPTVYLPGPTVYVDVPGPTQIVNIAEPYGMQAIFTACRIAVFGGTKPQSADHAILDAVLLYEIEVPSWILVGNKLVVDSSSTPLATAAGTGVASWFRLYRAGDARDTSSTVLPRIDGSISLFGGGGDWELNSVDVGIGAQIRVVDFSLQVL